MVMFSNSKNLQDFIKTFGALIKEILLLLRQVEDWSESSEIGHLVRHVLPSHVVVQLGNCPVSPKFQKYDKHWRRIFKRGTTSNPIHNSETKTLFKDIHISMHTHFIHSNWHLDVSNVFADCSARWRVRAHAVLLPLKTITWHPSETSKRPHLSGWALHCQSLGK